MKRLAGALALSLPLLSACTLVALSDEIQQQACSNDSDCEALNDLERNPANPARCMAWQCAPSHRCERERVDADRDGYEPLRCAPAGQGDCDDQEPLTHPGGEEVCDGRDNDCDQRMDEGVIDLTPRPALAFDRRLGDLGFTWNAASAQLATGYTLGPDAGPAGASLTNADPAEPPAATAFVQAPSELDRVAGISLGILGDRRYSAALLEPPPQRRIWVGALTADADGRLIPSFDPALLTQGLRCAAFENCSSFGVAPGELPQTPPFPVPASMRPSLSLLEDTPGKLLLAAYTRTSDAISKRCKPLVDMEDTQPILMNLLADLDPAAPIEISEVAVQLDSTIEPRSPSLIAIDTRLSGVTEPFGWLAGYTDTAGNLVVRQVAPSFNLVVSQAIGFINRTQRYFHVELTQGPSQPNLTLIGVAAQLGCEANASILFGIVRLRWGSTGDAGLSFYRDMETIAGSGAQRPFVTYNAERGRYAVVFSRKDGIYVHELDQDGIPIGDTAYYLGENSGNNLDTTITPGPEPQAGYAIYRYADSAKALESIELRPCRRR